MKLHIETKHTSIQLELHLTAITAIALGSATLMTLIKNQ